MAQKNEICNNDKYIFHSLRNKVTLDYSRQKTIKMNKRTIVIFAYFLLFSAQGNAQNYQWQALPGLDYDDRSIALINQESFMVLSGAAITSYILSEFLLKDYRGFELLSSQNRCHWNDRRNGDS